VARHSEGRMVTTRPLVLGLVVLVLGVPACSSGGGEQSTPTTGARHGPQASANSVPPEANPSASTKMVCEKEVRSEIAVSLGVHEIRVTTPTWADHVYSCTYVYPKGSVKLSVKELVSATATTAYFSGLANRLGRAHVENGLGRAAFVAKNDNVVARKDDKVLLVDVQDIPSAANAFLPVMKRSDVALNVAVAILGCWNGG
jgi:hypothetical protein